MLHPLTSRQVRKMGAAGPFTDNTSGNPPNQIRDFTEQEKGRTMKQHFGWFPRKTSPSGRIPIGRENSFALSFPEQGQVVPQLAVLEGTGTPNTLLQVRIDQYPPLTVRAEASGNWSIPNPYALSDGQHSIYIAQNRRIALRTRFVVDKLVPPPPPTIETPEDGKKISDRQPVISGWAAADSMVTVSLNGLGNLTVQAKENGWYALQYAELLPAGHYLVTVIQTTQDGQSSEARSTFDVEEAQPLPPPVLCTPANGAVLIDTFPIFSGKANPGSYLTIHLSGYGCITSTADKNGFFAVRFPAELAARTYLVTASQQDAKGQVSAKAQSTFTLQPVPQENRQLLPPVDSLHHDPDSRPENTGNSLSPEKEQLSEQDGTLPAPSIQTPLEGSILADQMPLISGTALPAHIVAISLSGHGKRFTFSNEKGQYAIRFPVLLTSGPYEIQVVQQDSKGNSSPAATRQVTIETAPPFLPESPKGVPLPLVTKLPQVCSTAETPSTREDAPAEEIEEIPDTILPDREDTPPAPPAPTIEMPAEGTRLSYSMPVLSGRGLPQERVILHLSGVGTIDAPTDSHGDYQTQWPVPLQEASYTVTAIQKDSFGQESSAVQSTFELGPPESAEDCPLLE